MTASTRFSRAAGASVCLLALLASGCPQGPGPTPTPAVASGTPATSASPSAASPAPSRAGGGQDGPALTVYPSEIAPPEGQQWPVPIQPLPPALGGIPASDRVYIETTFTLVLEAIDAKLRLLHAIKRVQEGQPLMDAGQRAGLKDKIRRYRTKTDGLQQRLTQLRPPATLASFHQTLDEAIGQQVVFFRVTIENKVAWKDMPELASAKRSRYLTARAWALLERAYPSLDAATKASLKSHLDALRLY